MGADDHLSCVVEFTKQTAEFASEAGAVLFLAGLHGCLASSP